MLDPLGLFGDFLLSTTLDPQPFCSLGSGAPAVDGFSLINKQLITSAMSHFATFKKDRFELV
jgi:hypothetical protein